MTIASSAGAALPQPVTTTIGAQPTPAQAPSTKAGGAPGKQFAVCPHHQPETVGGGAQSTAVAGASGGASAIGGGDAAMAGIAQALQGIVEALSKLVASLTSHVAGGGAAPSKPAQLAHGDAAAQSQVAGAAGGGAPVQQAPVQQTSVGGASGGGASQPVQQQPIQQTPIQRASMHQHAHHHGRGAVAGERGGPVQQAPSPKTQVQQTSAPATQVAGASGGGAQQSVQQQPVQQSPVQKATLVAGERGGPVQQSPDQQTPTQSAPKSGVAVEGGGGPQALGDVTLKDARNSITLRSGAGTSVRIYDDPHVEIKVDGKTEKFDIGYGAGGMILADGTKVSWDTNDRHWLRNFEIDRPGAAGDVRVDASDNDTADRLQTFMTDDQLREIIEGLRAYKGSASKPLTANQAAR